MLYLDDMRKQIDNIDQQIAKLLDHRLQICNTIGQTKKQKDLPIENTTREKEILNSINKMNLTYTEHIQTIMLNIFKESKNLQNALKRGDRL